MIDVSVAIRIQANVSMYSTSGIVSIGDDERCQRRQALSWRHR